MKIQIMSDLHLEFAKYSPPVNDPDVVILAGDIATGSNGVTWAKEAFDVPVIYVTGNHEYYSYHASMNAIFDGMRAEAMGSNVHVLDRDSFEIGGVRFLGTTMWTDLLDRPFGGVQCGVLGSDASHISTVNGELFDDCIAQELFLRNRDWLSEQINEHFDGRTVVITHHGPSSRSIHGQYAGNPWNSCFVTDLENMMGPSVDLWVHGHTHNNFDYDYNRTRVVCNPRGYPAPFGGWENSEFNLDMVVEV